MQDIDTCVPLPTNHKKKNPDNKDTRTTVRLPPFTSLRTFRWSARAPNVPIEPKFGMTVMSSLVHSRECAKATALSVTSFGRTSSLKFENVVPGYDL